MPTINDLIEELMRRTSIESDFLGQDMVRFFSLLALMAATAHAHTFDFDYAFSGMTARSSQDSPDMDSILAKISERENRDLPKALNADIRLDRIVAMRGRRLVRQFTVSGNATEQGGIAGLRRASEDDLKASACRDKTLFKFFRNGVSIIERYQDAAGQALREVSVSPADCA